MKDFVLFWFCVLKTAAGYHPGPVTPSTTVGAAFLYLWTEPGGPKQLFIVGLVHLQERTTPRACWTRRRPASGGSRPPSSTFPDVCRWRPGCPSSGRRESNLRNPFGRCNARFSAIESINFQHLALEWLFSILLLRVSHLFPYFTPNFCPTT